MEKKLFELYFAFIISSLVRNCHKLFALYKLNSKTFGMPYIYIYKFSHMCHCSRCPVCFTFLPAASPVCLVHSWMRTSSESCWESCRPRMVQTADVFPVAASPSTTSLSSAQHGTQTSDNKYTVVALPILHVAYIQFLPK